MAAAQNGDIKALRYLLSKGADPNARKKDDMTVLMVAAMFGHANCVESLLEAGVDYAAQDVYGYTALMFAFGSEACEGLLLAAEARGQTVRVSVSTLKKALSAAGKKGGKSRRAPKHKKLPPEKAASPVTAHQPNN